MVFEDQPLVRLYLGARRSFSQVQNFERLLAGSSRHRNRRAAESSVQRRPGVEVFRPGLVAISVVIAITKSLA
jgi:hypothetical protein